MRQKSLANFFEEPIFNFSDALFRVQYQRFILFHLRRDVSFCVNQGLFSDVFRRHLRGVAVGDFKIIAKDLVVADFERFDAGPLTLYGFQVGDPLSRVVGHFHHLIQFF